MVYQDVIQVFFSFTIDVVPILVNHIILFLRLPLKNGPFLATLGLF